MAWYGNPRTGKAYRLLGHTKGRQVRLIKQCGAQIRVPVSTLERNGYQLTPRKPRYAGNGGYGDE